MSTTSFASRKRRARPRGEARASGCRQVGISVGVAGRAAIATGEAGFRHARWIAFCAKVRDRRLRIWEKLLRSKSVGLPLPAIIPIVCHHSTVGWKVARTLRDLLALPRGEFPELEPHVPSFEPIIVDLSEAADDALRWR